MQLQLQLHYTTLHYNYNYNYNCNYNYNYNYTTLHYTAIQLQRRLQQHYLTLPYTRLHYALLHYSTQHSVHYTTLHYTKYTTPQLQLQLQLQLHTLITLHCNSNSTTLQLQLQLQLRYTTIHPAVVGEVTTATIAATPKKHNSNHPSVHPDSLCHSWFTTTNLSYRLPIFETSATALCGTTGIYSCWLNHHTKHNSFKWRFIKQNCGIQLNQPYIIGIYLGYNGIINISLLGLLYIQYYIYGGFLNTPKLAVSQIIQVMSDHFSIFQYWNLWFGRISTTTLDTRWIFLSEAKIKGPDNPTRQLLPIMSAKGCSRDGEGMKGKGGGEGSKS